MTDVITEITAYRRFDSRGNPTVEAIVRAGQFEGRALVPSGASTGIHEALEMRDNDEGYDGKDVEHAIANAELIEKTLLKKDPLNQRDIDTSIIDLDDTENKSNLGANDILAVSLATARLAANIKSIPLFAHISETFDLSTPTTLPVPMMNVLNGGAHANWEGSDFQEYMIMPIGATSFEEAMKMGTEVYHALERVLETKGISTQVGDEGGFVPHVPRNENVIEFIMEAISKANYSAGKDIVIALDPAVSELFDAKTNTYTLKTETKNLTREEMIALWEKWINDYPITSIEDGLDQDDWEGWSQLTEKLGSTIQLVGDDFLVTNTKRVQRAIESRSGNALLVKVNQIGTLTETIDAISLCQNNGWNTIISHRSGETEDTFISDLAVAVNAGQIKTGAPARSDRVAKYNRLLDIESIDLPKLGTTPQFGRA